jgi:hypothetical protein
VELFWDNASVDHATDPNNIVAKPASACARAILTVFIVASRCSTAP